MFIGRFYHTLETNGRVSLPKTFREQTQEWVLTRGLDGGLFGFKAEQFASELEKLSQRSFTKKDNRDFIRLMANEAHQTTVDKNGRVQLPEHLISTASLSKEVVIVGSVDRIEIWSRELYHNYLDQLTPQAESIAERVADDT